MLNSDAGSSICTMNISMLSFKESLFPCEDQSCPLPSLTHVFNVRVPSHLSLLSSSCPSFQRSTARCSIMGRSRSLALKKSLRSWCWPRGCWRRLEAVNHSSLNGSLWMRRQTKPMNVGAFNSQGLTHLCFFRGSGATFGQSNQFPIFRAISNLPVVSGNHSAQLD